MALRCLLLRSPCHLPAAARVTAVGVGGDQPSARHLSVSARRDGPAELLQSFAASRPVLAVQEGIVGLHDVSGLPWWATVLVTTVAARGLVTLPLGLYQVSVRTVPGCYSDCTEPARSAGVTNGVLLLLWLVIFSLSIIILTDSNCKKLCCSWLGCESMPYIMIVRGRTNVARSLDCLGVCSNFYTGYLILKSNRYKSQEPFISTLCSLCPPTELHPGQV